MEDQVPTSAWLVTLRVPADALGSRSLAALWQGEGGGRAAACGRSVVFLVLPNLHQAVHYFLRMAERREVRGGIVQFGDERCSMGQAQAGTSPFGRTYRQWHGLREGI